MKILEVFLMNLERAFYGYLIVVSAIIVLMGLLKKAAFNKIGNKTLRKVSLAFTSLVLVLPFTALYFMGDNINFKYYWIGCAMNGFALIVTYWFYENTALRDLINKIGSLTLGRFFSFIWSRIRGDNRGNVVEDLRETTKLVHDEVKEATPAAPVTVSLVTPKIPIATVSVAENRTSAAEKREQEKLKNL